MSRRRSVVPVVAGAICSLYALVAWLTVIPDADRLADGIQVQNLLREPHLVLAFPGQAHGGVLEYPVLLLAEWLAPGNYFAHSFARIIFAFFTGFFAARLFMRLFPDGPRWAFLTAVAVGPAVMHGLTGPTDNPVGVMWIHANYPQSWLLVTMGVSLLADAAARGRDGFTVAPWRLLLSGVVIALGVYEQPGVLIVAIPLIAMVILLIPRRWTVWLVAATGSVVGMVLIAAAWLLHHRDSVYNPAHLPRPDLSAAAGVLGLDGIPSYVGAILPAGLGFAPIDDSLIRRIAAVAVPLFVAAVLIGFVAAGIDSWRKRRASAAFALTTAWLLAFLGIVAMSWTLSPVWFYGGCMGVLVWISVGALPTVFRPPVGVIAAWACIALLVVSTALQTVPWYRDAVDHFSAKVDRMSDQAELADALVAAGATHVYGSYHDVLPVAYAAGGRLSPSAIYYDRFPLPDDVTGDLTVFVNLQPTEYHGDDALALVQESCTQQEQQVVVGDHVWGAFTCPRTLVSP